MDHTPLITYEIRVTGRVQGVGYRYFTLLKARSFNITGYVRNLPNGSVLILAQGTREQMDRFVKTLEKGPRSARVDNLNVKHIENYAELFTSFEIAF